MTTPPPEASCLGGFFVSAQIDDRRNNFAHVGPRAVNTRFMKLCDDSELSAAIDRLMSAFEGMHLTPGCRFELGINVIRSALASYTGPNRAAIQRYLLRCLKADDGHEADAVLAPQPGPTLH